MHDIPTKSISKRTKCRACASNGLILFLTLGPTPLANSFLTSVDEFESEETYPLDVYFCEKCSLVQLADVVDPRILFGNYIYVTGTANTIVAHNKNYARTVVDFMGLGPNDLVVEIASNNGQLLQCFREHEVKAVGVEPAGNIAATANAAGIETINRFFNSSTASEIRRSHGRARAVIANNVLAHVDETVDFLRGCKSLLADDGLVIIEVPYVKEFVESVEFDTVYHEHLCYFSITSLMRLCSGAGLSIVRVDRIPVHGGSIRIYAGRQERFESHAVEVKALADEERADGLTSIDTFTEFAARTRETREKLCALLNSLKAEGKTIAAYGAPAKGNTLLNYCGIDRTMLDFAVDKNPLKVGLYTPGTHLPVFPISEIKERRPDFLLILAWNFADEIMLQQADFKDRGGKFIIPIPEPRII